MSGNALLALLNAALMAAAVLLMLPLAVLSIECVAALLPRRRRSFVATLPRPSIAVIIPAHNEETILGKTLDAIAPQLREGDRLLVVADNCHDGTSSIARAHGAEVAERTDPDRFGKGYAMDFGLCHMDHNPPEIVVLMDADCHMHEGAIEALAQQVAGTGRPAQALYLLERPVPATLRDSVSAFAFLLKNHVRPLGLMRLGLPCLLYGAGMAFPWAILRRAPLADGNIVEDLQLGLDLALAGCPPLFCESALVSGKLPTGGDAALIQRRRWEHGHLRTIVSQVPRLLRAAVTRLSLAPLVLALDVSVPPLSFFTICLLLSLTAMGIAAWLGASRAAVYGLSAGIVLGLLCLLAAWVKFGRRTLPLGSLLAIPAYVVWKVPMYIAFLLRPQSQWVKTPRFTPPVPHPAPAPADKAGPSNPEETITPPPAPRQ